MPLNKTLDGFRRCFQVNQQKINEAKLTHIKQNIHYTSMSDLHNNYRKKMEKRFVAKTKGKKNLKLYQKHGIKTSQFEVTQ